MMDWKTDIKIAIISFVISMPLLVLFYLIYNKSVIALVILFILQITAIVWALSVAYRYILKRNHLK